MKTIIFAASAIALVANATVAQARPGQVPPTSAKSLSLSNAPGIRAPTSQASAQGNKLVGGGTGSLFAIFGSVAALLVFLEAVGAIDIIGGDDDSDSN